MSELETLGLTFFKLPDGEQQELEIVNIYEADEHYLFYNNIKISAEISEVTVGFILYFDDGSVFDDGSPRELIIFSNGRNAKTTFAEAVEKLKARKEVS